jgi:hypothetical protein
LHAADGGCEKVYNERVGVEGTPLWRFAVGSLSDAERRWQSSSFCLQRRGGDGFSSVPCVHRGTPTPPKPLPSEARPVISRLPCVRPRIPTVVALSAGEWPGWFSHFRMRVCVHLGIPTGRPLFFFLFPWFLFSRQKPCPSTFPAPFPSQPLVCPSFSHPKPA